jgi:hypothetical protein
MEVFLIEYNNRIIGVYDNLNKAELFIMSCLQNKLTNNSITYRI